MMKNRIGKATVALVLIPLLVVSSIGIAAYAARTPSLNSTVCTSIGGTWTTKTNTCTIPAGTISNITSGFSIPARYSLVIDGTLKITDVTIANSGTITVENVYDGGVTNTLTTGIILNGTLTNSGVITIKNSGTNSIGIETIYGYAMYNGEYVGYDLATLTNDASGVITIENSGDDSYGIDSSGFLTNYGVISIKPLTGARAHGIVNDGSFTNYATLNNYHGPTTPYTSPCLIEDITCVYGIVNGGVMINYGTTNNTGAIGTAGWAMFTYGTIYNYGTFYREGGELINYGTFDNYGTITNTSPNWPHNMGICINRPGAVGC